MLDTPARAIRIGALIDAAATPVQSISRLLSLGVETVALSFWGNIAGTDLGSLAAEVSELLVANAPAGMPVGVSALGCYGNVLGGDSAASLTLSSIESLIRGAPDFGASVVGCFAGRVPGRSVPDSIEAWKKAFGPLAELAAGQGVTIAFENCRLGDTWKTGKWNIAINPDAWQLMLGALPGAPLGLEWEPSHQILAMADPLVQLETWARRVVHVHAKDARIDRAALALHGIHGSTKIGVECRAGLGDTDWAALFGLLMRNGYRGSVDVEIGADPEYHGEREFEGIELALAWLGKARTAAASAARP
ncbi:MAG TPA: sugar phosphate isomerase/epimerase family protein [bacterium]|nr:sugar phosphate isomerase/epimerase family protein [bacterium]